MTRCSNGDTDAPAPPPNSWASKDEADLAVWHIRIEAGGRWTLPRAAGADTLRVLYAFEGSTVQIGEADPIDAHTGAAIVPDRDLELVSRRQQSSGADRELACRQTGRIVETIDLVNVPAVHQPVLAHCQPACATFFGRLKNHNSGPVKITGLS